MKIKNTIIIILMVLVFSLLFFTQKITFNNHDTINSYYRVYLNGSSIGLIESKDELYNLINTEQEHIRSEYAVDSVYPPSDFDIVKTNTYDTKLSNVLDIYSKIEEKDNFTIKGYIVTIKVPDEQENIIINVLDRKVFEEALNNYVHAFINEDTYKKYMTNTQDEIIDVGSIIEKMYFKESISIKEGFISVNEKIYTDVNDLSQYLLFGNNAVINSYTVKMGDTLSSIAENNKLNTQELLIANPEYRDENTILAIGDKLNVTLLNPVLNFIYEVHKVEDVETEYNKQIVYDNTKSYGYSEITQKGVTKITRVTEEYQVVNGEANSEIIFTNQNVLRESVPQITTKGKIYSGWPGSYVDTGLEWGWPTNTPYIITSGFAWRWGKHHDGIDISGTGEGSPIYAAGDGTVTIAQLGGSLGKDAGYNIVIQHANNYYTVYAHMVKGSLRVSVGQHVTKGQIIGSMGHTGFTTGTHLHYSVSIGEPYKSGSSFINPLNIYR